MKPTHVFLIGMVIVAAAGVVWTQTAAPPAGRTVAPVARVAVCDIGAVLNQYDRRNEFVRLFEEKRIAAKAEDSRRIDQIKQIEQELPSLKPGSGEHAAQLEKLETLTVSREVWRQVQERQLDREYRQLMEQMYGQVLEAVRTVARQKGYDVVFCTDSVEITSNTTSELLTKMVQRKCLYHNPAIDLSKDVLELLNSNYSPKK